jgi:tetratricopeptide (TPR) repeat protein
MIEKRDSRSRRIFLRYPLPPKTFLPTGAKTFDRRSNKTRSKPLIVLALLMMSLAATALAQMAGNESGTDQVKSTNLSEAKHIEVERFNNSDPEEKGERYLGWLEQNQWIILVIAALITIIAYVCGFLKYIKNIVSHGRENRNPEKSGSPTEEPKSPPSDVSDTPGKISNAPPYLSFNFTGREKHLSDLRAVLISNGRVAIYGLGGIGKTQLALRYIDQHKSDYKIIWWVKSGEPTTLASDYAELAEKLDLPKKDETDQKVIIEAVRNCLSQKGNWLLVFDNAEEPASVRNYLPQIDSGHVIITSRDSRDWKSTATPLEVTKFDRKTESIKFLLERTGQNDVTAADRLADALGDLPLALEQAGAYIQETGISIPAYLKLFQERHEELLLRGKPDAYPDTVATTWDLSFQKASEEVPTSADLLNLCAFLAPDDIPKSLLADGVKHLPEPLASAVKDKMALNDAVAALKRYSLITVADDFLSVHRLVQAVARDRLSSEERKRWAKAAVRLVNGAFPQESNDVRTWALCSVLLPHALAATEHAEGLGVVSKANGRLLNQVGSYLLGRGEFYEAKSAYEQALEIEKMVYSPNHPYVATIVSNLGEIQRNMGDLAGAKKSFEWALEIDEKVYGPDNFNVATDLNNLGVILKAVGDLAGAKKCLERALKIDEKILNPDHPYVARDLNNLGEVLRYMGDLVGAKSAFERALKILKKSLGPDFDKHPQVAVTTNNLGLVLKDMFDLEGAKEYFDFALKIDKKAFGSDFDKNPEVAVHFANLGMLLHDLGDLEGARNNLEKALEIFRNRLGENHPKTKTVRKNLESLRR